MRTLLVLLGVALTGCGASTVSGPSTFINDTAELSQAVPLEDDDSFLLSADPLAEAQRWEKQYQENPDSYDAARGFSNALTAAGSHEKASEIALKALRNRAGDGALLKIHARALLSTGKPDQALRALEAAKSGMDWSYYSLRGVCLDQNENHEEARRSYAKGLELSPGNPKIRNNQALSHALAGQPERAEKILRDLLNEGKADARIRQNLALILGAQGKFDEAARINAKDLDPQAVRENQEYYRWLLTPQRKWKEVEE